MLAVAHRRALLLSATSFGLLGWLAGCTSVPLPPMTPPTPPGPQPKTPPVPAARVPELGPPGRASNARSERDYRRDAASHLYEQNQSRIFKGKMPPLLYAIGVLQTELDARGHVIRFNWMRAPQHAPEVMAEIERTIRRASPFPAPLRLGRLTYTDSWLWHKSGQFQLDTLTEGQY